MNDHELKTYYSLSYDEDIHRLTLVFYGKEMSEGENSRLIALALQDMAVILASIHQDSCDMIVDLIPMTGDRPHITYDTLKETVDFLKSTGMRRIACVGSEVFLQNIINTLAYLSQGPEVRWFTNIHDAEVWLNA